MKLPLIVYFAVASYLFPAIAGIVRYKRLNSAMKVFSIFCVFTFLMEIFELILNRKHVNNTSISNYYVPVELIFISIVYLLSIGSKRTQRAIWALTLLFLCIWILDKIYFDVQGQTNIEMAVTSRIFIILISVSTIYAIVNQLNRPVTHEPIFWVSSGTLIYSTGVTIILVLMNELLKMGIAYYQSAWYINWSLEILCNSIFVAGFFCTPAYQTTNVFTQRAVVR
jgi:hypothetical protein